jgi:hypothetical protein
MTGIILQETRRRCCSVQVPQKTTADGLEERHSEFETQPGSHPTARPRRANPAHILQRLASTEHHRLLGHAKGGAIVMREHASPSAFRRLSGQKWIVQVDRPCLRWLIEVEKQQHERLEEAHGLSRESLLVTLPA